MKIAAQALLADPPAYESAPDTDITDIRDLSGEAVLEILEDESPAATEQEKQFAAFQRQHKDASRRISNFVAAANVRFNRHDGRITALEDKEKRSRKERTGLDSRMSVVEGDIRTIKTRIFALRRGTSRPEHSPNAQTQASEVQRLALSYCLIVFAVAFALIAGASMIIRIAS